MSAQTVALSVPELAHSKQSQSKLSFLQIHSSSSSSSSSPIVKTQLTPPINNSALSSNPTIRDNDNSPMTVMQSESSISQLSTPSQPQTTVHPSSQGQLHIESSSDYLRRTYIAILFLTPLLIAFILLWLFIVSRAHSILSHARNITLIQVVNIIIVSLESLFVSKRSTSTNITASSSLPINNIDDDDKDEDDDIEIQPENGPSMHNTAEFRTLLIH